ncbi:hypothetical protein P255_01189 [Acinetobacter brisouii CIP 110357]|uniref:Uncharacterized protein n=1 Tax=Acinetobacter brisouii CIP 110357 TaxID=1341683 RepID=V2UT03_9GAMM|nr:hypothetical protein [Acinetobacter brisouii]ENV48308.1 hypothetical protein F954_01376 [Acinetobacter brisouii ANC 4119]ESK51760.1 hypothetical protein P255_01189 [Acinetobacter brisouii CIP 110357]
MKTIVKYIALKNKDYQLGHALFEEELEETGDYFDRIPSHIQFQNLQFKVKSKELTRKQVFDDVEESQTIIVKVIAVTEA